jgi:hypothetical protein
MHRVTLMVTESLFMCVELLCSLGGPLTAIVCQSDSLQQQLQSTQTEGVISYRRYT